MKFREEFGFFSEKLKVSLLANGGFFYQNAGLVIH